MTLARAAGVGMGMAPSQMIQQQWTTENGLAQNSVYALVQDRDGYVWFGSESGVARFDGVRFEIFNENSAPSIPNNLVTSLLVASDGSVWVGSRTGGLVRYLKGIFEIPFPSMPHQEVTALAQTPDGLIWIGSPDGLLCWDGARLAVFSAQAALPNRSITALHANAASGDLWIGMSHGEIARLRGGRIENLKLGGKSGAAISEIRSNPKTGEVWTATDGDGLFVKRTNGIERIDLLPRREVENIQALCIDGTGTIWAGTQYDGVICYKDGTLSHFDERDGLSQKNVTSLMADREGSVWIGTLYGGLNQLRACSFATFGPREGLPAENIRCVLEEAPGRLLITTSGSGLFRLRIGTGFERMPLRLSPSRFDTEDIRAVLPEGKGLWIGTSRAGLFWASENGMLVPVPFSGENERVEISVLFKRRNGELWVGSRRSGTAVYAPGSAPGSRPEQFFNVPFLKTHIRCFAEDEQGVLWIGTQDGLVRYADGKFQPEFLKGFPDASIRSILVEKENTLWIATRDYGLLHLRDGVLHRFDPSIGLKQSRIFDMIHAGPDLWLAGNRGVERVSIASLDAIMSGREKRLGSRLFTEQDGLRTSDCSAESKPSTALGSDGRIWFATRRGLSVIDPARIPTNNVPPSVVIREVRIDDRLASRGKYLKVPPGATRIEINYAALSLRNAAKVLCRYKLDGVDKDWVEAGKLRQAVYYNLKPGPHRFEVRACNDDGLWTPAGAVLNFFVQPHFYQMLWFRTACAFVVIGIIARGFKWRVRRVQGDNKKLERLVAARTRELEKEAGQRKEAEQELLALNTELEQRVDERTAQLTDAVDKIQCELRERHKAEQALARSEARLRRIVDSGMVGILFWTKDGQITEANDTFLQIIGYSREDMEAGMLTWTALTPEEHLPRDAAALEEIRRSGVCAPFEKEYFHKNGSRVPVLLGGASLSPEGERGVCFVLDISETKKTEEHIRVLNQSLEVRVQERTLQLERLNGQLAEEVQERKRVAVALSALSQLGQKLHSARTEEEAAAIIAETAQTLIPHHSCSVALYGATNQLSTIIESNVAESAGSLRSSISVPIRNGTRVVGVLGVKSAELNAFNSSDANTLQALGDYCGGALDRIHAEAARRETDRRFSAFMANAPALAWMKDAQFRYVFTNKTFHESTGLSAAEVEGKTDFDLWPREIAERMRQHDLRALETQAPFETQEPAGNGADRILLSLRFLFTTATGEQYVAGMAVDITEQKRAEEALHRLPQSIIEAQETERRRVARELHDGVNQAIASAKFRIQTAEQQIARGDPKWQETCGKSKEMLDSVLQQVRRLSRNLRPGELDDFGLIAAVRSACQEFEARTGIELHFEHVGLDFRLPPVLELSLYRIVQEALTNIEKHANATVVSITLNISDEMALLEIDDNGRGFDPREIAAGRRGLGLLHMRERASLVRGGLEMHSEPGGGVRISVSVPIKPNLEPANE